jgi:hypothetical protein
MTPQRMVGRKVAERMMGRRAAQETMGRQMMRRHRRRGLLREGVTGEAHGKRGRGDEGLDHGAKPSNFVEELIVPYSR